MEYSSKILNIKKTINEIKLDLNSIKNVRNFKKQETRQNNRRYEKCFEFCK